MRVGFSIVAGAVASVLMCFGFFVAHFERITDETAQWRLSETDHMATLSIGNHSPDPGTGCNRMPNSACADAADLVRITENLDNAGDDWLFTADVMVKVISAPHGSNPMPDASSRLGMSLKSIQVYARSGGDAPMVAGTVPRAENEIALNADLAAQLGVDVGDTVLVDDRDHTGRFAPLKFTVTGLTAIAATYIPFSTVEVGYPDLYLGSTYAIVSTAALPSIIGEHDVAAFGLIYWNGTPELVTSVLPGVTVKDGYALPRGPWYHANWWMAMAVALAMASVAWWALLARRRGRNAWRDGALLIPIPPVAGLAIATVAALAHAAWVRQIAPYTFLPKPLPLSMPWTITALAAGVAVAAVGAAWRESRLARSLLQHHEVVDVDERMSEGLA
jgi:hypothetical protein